MLIYFVIVPILIAVFLYLFPFEKIARIIAISVQTGLLGATFYLFYLTREQDLVTVVGDYDGILGIALRADALSSVFVLLTAFIFLMVALYSFSDKNSRLFWFLLFIWEGTLIGVFLAGDLFNIFVLTEVATLIVSVLIMYNKNNRSMYDGLIYLMINFVVIQFYLLGLGYLYRILGVMDMEAVSLAIRYLQDGQLVLPYALIMTFIALKCALMPLFSWLPKAHSTPGASPSVSAVLSGLHIKSGIYLFLRFQYIFEGVAVREFFIVVGLVTAVIGVAVALSQRDIKRILAYSTIAQTGIIVAGLSTGNIYNYMGALYHIINHAIFKSALFLSAGIIVRTYGTRDIYKIRGVVKRMPVVGIASILALLGIIGMPAFNGSVSKYFLTHGLDNLTNVIMIIINFGTVMVFIKYGSIFIGKAKQDCKPFERDMWKQVPLIILGGLCLVFGVFGEYFMFFLFNWEAYVSVLGYLEKSLIFAISLIVGVLIFKYWKKDGDLLVRISEIDLGFREMCAAIGVFFGMILVVAGFF